MPEISDDEESGTSWRSIVCYHFFYLHVSPSCSCIYTFNNSIQNFDEKQHEMFLDAHREVEDDDDDDESAIEVGSVGERSLDW